MKAAKYFLVLNHFKSLLDDLKTQLHCTRGVPIMIGENTECAEKDYCYTF